MRSSAFPDKYVLLLKSVLLYLFLFPFLLIPGLLNPYMGKLYIGEMVLILISVFILSEIRVGKTPVLFIRNDIFLMFYVFFLGLSSFFSAYGGYALRGCVISFILLLFYFYFRYVLAFFRNHGRLFIRVLMISSTVFAACSLAVVLLSRPWRVKIFFGNTLFLSNIFLVSLPVLLSVLIERLRCKDGKLRETLFVFSALIINLGALYFTRSKTAAAVCFIALTVPLAAASGNPKKLMLGFASLAVITAIILLVLPYTRKLIFYDAAFGTASIRFYIYSGALKMLKHTLFLGTGAYTFFLSYPPYIVTEYFSLPLSAEATYHAHNYFLETFIESGAVGFLFLMVFFANILSRLYKKMKIDIGKGEFITTGVFSAVIANFLFNMFNINMNAEYFYPYCWIWLAVGSVFAWEKEFSATGRLNRNTINLIFVLIFLGTVFWHLKTALISEYFFDRGVVCREKGDYPKSSEYFHKGLSENPFSVEALSMAAYVEGNLGNYGRAVFLYDEILKYSPYFGSTMFNKANALFNLGEYDEAETLLVSRLGHNPYDSGARINLGMIYNIKGDRERALKMNLSVLEYDETDVDAAYNSGVILFEMGKIKEAETMLKGSLDLVKAHKNNLVTENMSKMEQSVMNEIGALDYKKAVILANLAVFYNSTGDRQKAKEYLDEARREGKNNAVVEDIRRKMLWDDVKEY
ncbi:MAG: O-antigen ligase family protein [bacterium]|nr:O-antigen ligase family protein [bacterium]